MPEVSAGCDYCAGAVDDPELCECRVVDFKSKLAERGIRFAHAFWRHEARLRG